MVAIVLMDELWDARKARDEIRDDARAFAERLIARIDEVLAAGQAR
jgi:hypothetical protein